MNCMHVAYKHVFSEMFAARDRQFVWSGILLRTACVRRAAAARPHPRARSAGVVATLLCCASTGQLPHSVLTFSQELAFSCKSAATLYSVAAFSARAAQATKYKVELGDAPNSIALPSSKAHRQTNVPFTPAYTMGSGQNFCAEANANSCKQPPPHSSACAMRMDKLRLGFFCK